MARYTCAVAALGCGLAVAITTPALARPVSYQGGWTIIEETNRQNTSFWLHYTLNPKLSVGYRGEWDRQMDVMFNGGQATYLVNRWFGENYQGNVYAFAGAGVAEGVNDNPASAAFASFAGVMADWETRRWFASYQARAFDAGEVDKSFAHRGKVGVAPYVGNTGDLHTWLMVEVDHRPDNANPVGVTPMVRFFTGPTLLELGWSVTDDQPLINFAYRF